MPALPRRPSRTSRLLVLVLLLIAAGASEDENWQRLRSMPREQRSNLARKMEEFDRLGRDEKARIRALDERLSALPAADQANYRAVMRRYHLWIESLSAEQRQELASAPSNQKMALVAKFRSAQNNERDGGPTPLVFQLADLRGRSPFEVAHLLEVWFQLTPEQRSSVEKLGIRERTQKMREFEKSLKVKPLGKLSEREEDEALKQMDRNLTKGFLRSLIRAKGDTEKPIVDRRRLANNYHFLANPPRSVEPSNLFRFESAMPSWLRASFDHLPPQEAKRRLTILYRLIYPAGHEISDKPTPASPAPKAKPNARPSAPGTAPSSRPGAPATQTTPPPI